ATGEFEFGVVPTPLQPIVVTTIAAAAKRIAPIVTLMIPSVDVEVIFNCARGFASVGPLELVYRVLPLSTAAEYRFLAPASAWRQHGPALRSSDRSLFVFW